MRLFFYIFFLVFFINSPVLSNKIEYVSVTSKGIGATYTEALNNALSNAIAQVNGRSIETNTSLNKISKSITSNNEKSIYSSKEFQKTIKEKTEGYVSNFKIISENKSDKNIITIKVSADIGKFKLKKSAKRKRIAVLPFYHTRKYYNLFDNLVDAGKIDRLLTQNLVSYLVQTRKFTVLDREYLKDIDSELSVIKNNETTIEETVKLGQKLFSDYILVGTLEKFVASEKEIKIKNSKTVVKSLNASIEFNYRIIDVPTSQIMYSDNFSETYQLNDPNITSPESEIIKRLSLSIGNKILYAIYPLRIEKITNNTAYIGQGGSDIKVDTEYEIYELGEKIKDSYTNEYIGREETLVGKLKISNVGAKISYGEIIEENYSLQNNFEPKKFTIKLIVSKISKIDQVKDNINNNKKENSDDDW